MRQICIELTDEEYADIERIAKRDNRSVEEYVRYLVVEDIAAD